MRRAAPRGRRGSAIARSSGRWPRPTCVLSVNPRDLPGVKARLRPGAPPGAGCRPSSTRGRSAPRRARGAPTNDAPAAAQRRHDAHARQARLLPRAGAGACRCCATGRGRRCSSATARRAPRSSALMAPFGERVALRRRPAARRSCRLSMPPPTSTFGRRSTRPMAWPFSRPRPPACPSSPAAPAACPRS